MVVRQPTAIQTPSSIDLVKVHFLPLAVSFYTESGSFSWIRYGRVGLIAKNWWGNYQLVAPIQPPNVLGAIVSIERVHSPWTRRILRLLHPDECLFTLRANRNVANFLYFPFAPPLSVASAAMALTAVPIVSVRGRATNDFLGDSNVSRFLSATYKREKSYSPT